GACGADPGWVELCQRCLAVDPADRPADGKAVADAVAGLRAAADERARQAELDRVRAEGDRRAAELAATEQRRRRKWQLALTGSLLVLVTATGAGAWLVQKQVADRERVEAEKVRVAVDRDRA